MTLTYAQAIEAEAALRRLDAGRDGKSFDLKVGVRLAVVRNLVELARATHQFETLRVSRIRELAGVKTGPAELKEGSPEHQKFLVFMEELLREPVEIKLGKIELVQLDLERNAIPFSSILESLIGVGILVDSQG